MKMIELAVVGSQCKRKQQHKVLHDEGLWENALKDACEGKKDQEVGLEAGEVKESCMKWVMKKVMRNLLC